MEVGKRERERPRTNYTGQIIKDAKVLKYRVYARDHFIVG